VKIAIDGAAGSGKTTLGQALARHFGCRFVETGKMYRCVALALSRCVPLEEVSIDVSEDGAVLLNGEDVSENLYTDAVDQAASRIATRSDVRKRLLVLQRGLAEKGDVVMEGRDIGTVVLPDADVKLFLTADVRVRAERRCIQRGCCDVARVVEELAARDRRDKSRSLAPLKPADDATIIHTDRNTLAEVISEAIDLVKERLDAR
jgi:cytidylate kinase